MSSPQVTIEQGTLRGSIGTNLKGESFYKFQGIPYAKPPLGELRFKIAQPPEKWNGIWDATKEGAACYARDPIRGGKFYGSENCLFLNVFTKKLPETSKDLRPVLFWIHGGAFLIGSGCEELYGPNFLLTQDIVLVTINYRLGLLGFLNFEDPSLNVPGNNGLKDQVMALKWVQKNISKFGGNPNNVTIFGQSAGGASVHLHTLSSMSKGLFHKAIAQSGCALNPWVQATRGSKALAKAMGLEGASERVIHEALMKKSVEEVYEIQEKLKEDLGEVNVCRLVGFVVERSSKEAFLDKEPIDVILSGSYQPVPYLTGFTSKEGMLFEMFQPPEPQSTPYDCEKMIPWFLGYQYGTSESKKLGEKIKKFYFGDEEPSQKNQTKKLDLVSDVQFIYGIYTTVINQFQKSPTYLYKMTVESGLNFFKKIVKVTEPGVCHSDDIGYLFHQFMTPEIQRGSLEEASLDKFVKLWTNFAKFGKPTPDPKDPLLKVSWKAVSNPNLDYLEIGEELLAKENPERERMQFWKNVFEESPAGQKTQCCFIPKM